ncbi:MAG: cytochrome c biogenesis protein DipZ [Chlamydiae bacterium]|nr:cytochrome c biogenesis protein DipZ [Chlamydiota bacterium]
MVLLLIFSFLAGIVTVLSPCVLPVLPAILSAGATDGKLRPLGIILGLITSFSFFTLTLTALIEEFGISANILRNLAIFLVFAFGIVMLFPKLSNAFAKFTYFFATAGQKIQGIRKKDGFWSGIVLGVALGLLWTPCAGPILATITTLVATRGLSLDAVFLTLSYSIGTGVPLFFIAYGSQKIIHSSRFLSKHAEGIRQSFGVLMILLAALLAFHWEMLLEQKLIHYVPQVFIEKNPQIEKGLKKLRGETSIQGKAPELVGIVGWINSTPLSLEDLKGKVVLIDFWTYSCINCLRTLPFLEKWDDNYRDKGLVIIGIHTPEFAFEKDRANVEKAVQTLGIQYPVALDNNYETWQAYHNQYWPAHYLIDQNGNLRMIHFGEGAYGETENAIRSLLGLSTLVMQDRKETTHELTPETYLGLERAHSYTSQISIKPNKVAQYSYKTPLENDQVGLRGLWSVENEFILSEGDDSFLDLNFLAKQVYLVLSGVTTTPLQVYMDGKFIKEISFTGPQKYDIVKTEYRRHQLSIKIPKGIKAYAFTFGDE